MAFRLVWPALNSLWQSHLDGGLKSSVEGLSVGTVVDCSFACKERSRRVSFRLPVNWWIEAKHKCMNKPPPGFQACTLLPRPSLWSKGGRTWKMLNVGPIKFSLQRQRPLGREKPPLPPTPCHYYHSDSFYEQNILKVNSRGSLKNTHSAPNECSIFDFLSLFFCHFHAWAWGFQWKTLWKWSGERRNRTTNPWAEYQWIYGRWKVQSREGRNMHPRVKQNHDKKSLNVTFKTALGAT